MAVITSKLIVALVDQLSVPARGVARVVKDLQAASRANAMQMNEMRGRMVDAAAAAWAVGKALADPIGKAVEFESAMADVAKVSDFSTAGLDQFGQDLRRLSTSEIPMAVTELAALAENAAAAGIDDSELLEFTRLTAKAALAWGVSGAQAGEDLAKIREALRLTTGETMLYADAINFLSDRTASTAPDLTEFTRRVAAQGEFFGFTKEETLAFGAAMISAGAEVEVASTSFRNMGRALTKGTSASKSQQRAFKMLGLDARKVAAGMQKDAVGTTMEVIKRLGQLPAELQAAAMGDLFGDEARALAPLLGNMGLLRKTLGYVTDETDYAGSVAAEFARRAQTTEFNLQRLKNQVDGVALAIGNALLPAVNGVAAAVGPMIIALADWAAAHPQIVQAIVAIIGGLVALRVASIATRWAFLFMKGGILDAALLMSRAAAGILALINPLNLVKNAVTALRVALMMSGIGLALALIAAAGTWIYNNWDGLVAFFEGFGEGVSAALAPVMPVIQPIVDGGKAILDWVTGLLGPVGASSDTWRDWGKAAGTAVGDAVIAVVNKGAEIIAWFEALPGRISSGVSGMAAAVVEQFSKIAQQVSEAFLSIDWIDIGKKLMNAIWEGMKAIIPAMLDGLGSAIAQLNPFGGGAIEAPVQGHGGNVIYPVGQAPGVTAAKAAGGSISGGKTYLVGEEGPELVTPGRSGWVHPADATARLMGAGRPPVTLSVYLGGITIHGVTDPQQVADLAISRINEKLGDAVGGMFSDIEFAGG
ncbi:phage tail tape measure protein [Youhaiella tibetensis]|uniref:Phage tail tape measure protein n=1 Tax=Paradevosia tibetensis TaxID=1447062 RepID=A0A5B9DHX9_9HYPH|nr:phage tail tape measure protein [Youhaiella tibetensis]QEE18901.1 phage tail tape measure protein [Youhaiella tibetensis]GGF38160.1 phage tail tape measure protein [Youhaiella tibetensis]